MKLAQRLAFEWGCRCFGRDHMMDLEVRALRLAEEAVELAQACQVPKEQMLKAVEMVYARPTGKISQEAGGVAVTLSVFCAILGTDSDTLMEEELSRVLSKSPEHFAKRNEEKINLLGS